jgi:hypothetical protein
MRNRNEVCSKLDLHACRGGGAGHLWLLRGRPILLQAGAEGGQGLREMGEVNRLDPPATGLWRLHEDKLISPDARTLELTQQEYRLVELAGGRRGRSGSPRDGRS